MQVNCIHKANALLAECPRWDPITGRVYWTDIDGKAMGQAEFDGSWASRGATEHKVGSFVFNEGGGMILATADGVYYSQPFIGPAQYDKLWDYPEPELSKDGGRFNDGCCDPMGRFVVGCMDGAKQGRAGVYSYERGAIMGNKVLDGFTTFNGLAFTPDGTEAWFTDSQERTIWRASYDIDTGEFGSRKEVIVFPSDEAPRPDGGSFDTNGNYWVAMYAGGCVHCIHPEGEVIATIKIPASFTTMAAFAGYGLDHLVVTTAHREDEEELAQNPDAGSIYLVAGVPAKGFNTTQFC